MLGFKVNKMLWITFYTAKHYFSKLLPVKLRLFIKNGLHGWRASCIWTVNFKQLQEVEFHSIKGAPSSLIQFLETGSPIKMMKNAFYFTLKALLVLMIFKFLCWLFVTKKAIKNQARSAWNFLQLPIPACSAYICYFKINPPNFCCPLFSENYLNPQVRINKMVNKHTVDYPP